MLPGARGDAEVPGPDREGAVPQGRASHGEVGAVALGCCGLTRGNASHTCTPTLASAGTHAAPHGSSSRGLRGCFGAFYDSSLGRCC